MATHQQVRALAAQGWWGSAIAEYLHIEPHTAYKYMELEQIPEPHPMPRPSAAEPYRAYLEERWAQGCTTIRQLWREILAQGYSGKDISVWRITRSWVFPSASEAASALPRRASRPALRTPHHVAWLLQSSTEQKEADREYLEALFHACPEIGMAAHLAQAFRQMLHEQRVEDAG